MKFRPCIDIHNGKVKQIVGGSLLDSMDRAKDNFVSDRDAGYYAALYKSMGLSGGHVILLNPAGSRYYEEDVRQACMALSEYPGGLQAGGGMNPDNASLFLDAGASHVIVTSYVFRDGKIHFDRLKEMVKAVGKDRLVLDLSCRKKRDGYYVVTDRWQKFSDVRLDRDLLCTLRESCAEFLVHAVDAEGMAKGIEEDVAKILTCLDPVPVTYAGGVGSYEDIVRLKEIGRGKIDVTIGSALDLFGGQLSFSRVLEML